MEERKGLVFTMPKIWEIDGKLYKVTLNEIPIHTSPHGGPIPAYVARKLVFTPLVVEPPVKE